MMKLFSNILLIFFMLSMAGCSSLESKSHESENKIATTTEKMNGESDNNSEYTEKTYSSISEYTYKFMGKHHKTGKLDIVKESNYLKLSMNISLSRELIEMMLNTKNKIYFNITDLDGRDNLTKVLDETPKFVEADLDKLRYTNILLISQKVKIKKDISTLETKELLSPENYELQVLDENGLPVAIVIGLQLDMIN